MQKKRNSYTWTNSSIHSYFFEKKTKTILLSLLIDQFIHSILFIQFNSLIHAFKKKNCKNEILILGPIRPFIHTFLKKKTKTILLSLLINRFIHSILFSQFNSPIHSFIKKKKSKKKSKILFHSYHVQILATIWQLV